MHVSNFLLYILLYMPHVYRRRFEVQVQGKFKKQPTGEIYVGAETSNKMVSSIIIYVHLCIYYTVYILL